ncbi:MAG TPA: hypothetical protein VFB41_02005 [Solirubrobacteraceae bacterium]|nr:hypothetical protein [Solirubrobacteraceae bacterium]
MLASAVLAGCGGGDEGASTASTATTSAPSAPAPSGRFAIGITEANPHLIAPGAQPAAFAPWRDRLVALKPDYVRVLVDWARLQPERGRAPDFAQPADGCLRGGPPCAPYAGLRATLDAIARLKAEPVLVLYGTPPWAARRVAGCERPGTTSYQRMPKLAAYRSFVRSLLALTRSLKLEHVSWSAWNEPNTPGFLNPQRSGCGNDQAKAVSPGLYTKLVRTMATTLGDDPGQRMLLGETAGVPEGRPKAVGAAEFARHLPDDLVCGAAAWAQHAHLVRPRGGGKRIDKVPVAETARLLTGVERALDGHHCSKQVPVWITETGVGDAPHGCAIAGRQLDTWKRDRQVRAAFQYTLREDPVFPVGLADPQLTTLYPAYRAWRERGVAGC